MKRESPAKIGIEFPIERRINLNFLHYWVKSLKKLLMMIGLLIQTRDFSFCYTNKYIFHPQD